MAPRTAFGAGLLEGLRPSETLSVSRWADCYRKLPSDEAAIPGDYQTDLTPYWREPQDHLGPESPIEGVVIMKAAQVGATELANNWVGHTIDNDPCRIMYVMPTVEAAQETSKMRLAPMIASTPRLSERVFESKSRDAGNTIMLKKFVGGSLKLAGANSAVSLRSSPIRKLILDEIDGYPVDVDGEGDPVRLAVKRTATFEGKRKILYISTPTDPLTSRIAKLFDATDQRYRFVPCPFCDHFQRITWNHIKWVDDDPSTACMECEKCHGTIEESWKERILARGQWRATAKSKNPLIVGYHLSALYSTLGFSWQSAVEEFLEARREGQLAMRVWANQVLGETYEDEMTQVLWVDLHDRAEIYEEECPEGVLMLTSGVDVGVDRIEMGVWGWGRGEESWPIEHRVFFGNPETSKEVWQRLDEARMAGYRHALLGDKMKMYQVAQGVDSGFATEAVYRYCYPRFTDGVYCIKGDNREDQPIVRAPTKGRRYRGTGTPPLFMVGTFQAKRRLFAQLALQQAGYGFVHFRVHECFPREWYEQLVGEKLNSRKRRGRVVRTWDQVHARVEALDIRNYAYAVMKLYNPNWDQLEQRIAAAAGGPRAQTPRDQLKESALVSRARRRRSRRDPGPY